MRALLDRIFFQLGWDRFQFTLRFFALRLARGVHADVRAPGLAA